METITEDYISFETAKILKEKGFDEPCDVWYSEYSSQFGDEKYTSIEFDNHNKFDKDYKFICSAPTLQMAMKWLMEVHNVNIEIHYNRFGENYKYLIIYKPEVLDDIRSLGVFYSYEEACEAAINYCLENLI